MHAADCEARSWKMWNKLRKKQMHDENNKEAS